MKIYNVTIVNFMMFKNYSTEIRIYDLPMSTTIKLAHRLFLIIKYVFLSICIIINIKTAITIIILKNCAVTPSYITHLFLSRSYQSVLLPPSCHYDTADGWINKIHFSLILAVFGPILKKKWYSMKTSNWVFCRL
jgi:hypothetical protein